MTASESTLAIDFTALYISGSHADIRVVAKDGELPAHRAILAARSPKLIEEGLLVADEEGRQGRVLKFPTLPLSVMEAFVQALYTNTLAIVRARCAWASAAWPSASANALGALVQTHTSTAGRRRDRVWPDGAGAPCGARGHHQRLRYVCMVVLKRIVDQTLTARMQTTGCADVLEPRVEGLFSQNLNKDTAIKSLLVASQYNLVVLKKQALTIIVKDVRGAPPT